MAKQSYISNNIYTHVLFLNNEKIKIINIFNTLYIYIILNIFKFIHKLYFVEQKNGYAKYTRYIILFLEVRE